MAYKRKPIKKSTKKNQTLAEQTHKYARFKLLDFIYTVESQRAIVEIVEMRLQISGKAYN